MSRMGYIVLDPTLKKNLVACTHFTKTEIQNSILPSTDIADIARIEKRKKSTSNDSFKLLTRVQIGQKRNRDLNCHSLNENEHHHLCI